MWPLWRPLSSAPEDQGRSEEATTGRPRTISKAAFGCLSCTLFILILATEIAIALAMSKALGVRLEGGGWTVALAFLSVVLSRVAADGILKRMGRSRSGRTVEVRGRTVAHPEGEVGDDEVVEVHCPSLTMGAGVMCVLFCLVIVLTLVMIPHNQIKGVGYAYVLIGISGLGAGYCFYERWCGEPQARAERAGDHWLPRRPPLPTQVDPVVGRGDL